MTTPRSHQSPDSDDQKPTTADDATEAFPSPATEGATDDATEAMPLANGYEYVTEDSGSTRTVVDTDDDSLAFGLMRNGDVVEKLTREERRADRAAEKAAAKEAERAEEARRQAALAAAAAAAAERDQLNPRHAEDEQEEGKIGSKVFFVGSAVLTAAAIALVAAFLLPLNDESSQQTTVEATPTPTVAETSPSVVESSSAAPVPSFNTKAPTVTEQDGGTEEPVAPGNVLYAPTEEVPAVEQIPEPSALEPTLDSTEEETPVAEETLVLEPTQVANDPGEVVAPGDATPTDEPDRSVETSATDEGSAASVPLTPADEGNAVAPTAAAATGSWPHAVGKTSAPVLAGG